MEDDSSQDLEEQIQSSYMSVLLGTLYSINASYVSIFEIINESFHRTKVICHLRVAFFTPLHLTLFTWPDLD